MAVDPRSDRSDVRPPDIQRVHLGGGVYAAVPAAADGFGPPDTELTASGSPVAGRRWSVPAPALPAAAAAALAAVLRLGATSHAAMAAGVLAVLAVIAAIDLRWRLVPNKIVGPATAAVLAWQLAFAPGHALEWIVAAASAPVVLLLPSLVKSGAIGMGDVKLAGLLGAALGAAVVPALMLGFIAVVPVAVVLLARGGASAPRTMIPFAPFMAFGAAVTLLA
jgi:leader peptidase (prepilin peptidase)/N-methyltransferase